jgi:diguanylate cyclase
MYIVEEWGGASAASYEKHVLSEINRIARGDVFEGGLLADGIPARFQKALRRLSATVQSYRCAAETERQRARTTTATETMLSEALNVDQFELYFQPQLGISRSETPAVEALIRWNHPEHGIVMPQDFLPLAERAGLMSEVGRWVLTAAIGAIARLEQAGMRCRIAVNLSASDLVRQDLIEHVRGRLRQTGASAALLEIEVTESAMMISEALSCEQLRLLRDEGVSIAIDDFGTGYSNLSRLARMPIDRLKIDRSLTNGVLGNGSEREIVACIVRLGKVLGHEVTAEGVESHNQARALIEMGCDSLQGFHVSRPLRESELVAWLPRHYGITSVGKC